MANLLIIYESVFSEEFWKIAFNEFHKYFQEINRGRDRLEYVLIMVLNRSWEQLTPNKENVFIFQRWISLKTCLFCFYLESILIDLLAAYTISKVCINWKYLAFYCRW